MAVSNQRRRAIILFRAFWQGIRYFERYTFRPIRLSFRFPTTAFEPGAYATPDCRFQDGVRVGGNSIISGSSIGRHTYVANDARISDCDIGGFCSIGPGTFIGLASHPLQFVSTHPFFYHKGDFSNYYRQAAVDYVEYCRTRIGSDVWIGAGAIVLGGLAIGDGAVVGAGAVLTHSLEPYQIAAGVPAKVIRSRFGREQALTLQRFAWWEKSDEWLMQNRHIFRDVEEFHRHPDFA